MHPDVLERWGLDELAVEPSRLGPLVRPWQAGDVRVLQGEAATLASLRSLDPGRARIFQFLGHGVRDYELERPARLVLAFDDAHDGLVSCLDVEADGAAAELVLLTSCRSGGGPTRRGDGAMSHLGGSFLRCGARAVVASPTDLALEPALRMSATVHEALAAGASPAEALRRARAALVADGEWADAFFHAQYRVLGLGQQPLP